MDIIERFFTQYRFLEFSTRNTGTLPKSPTDKEKYLYLKRNNLILSFFATLSFFGVSISLFTFLSENLFLWPFLLYFLLTVIYFSISFIVNVFSKDFDFTNHQMLVKKWKGHLHQRVDIFLPTAGEPLEVLNNTWEGITKLVEHHKGVVTVYCLDDADRQEVRSLAAYYNFTYVVRPKRGWFKKAGNLRYGYKISNSEFIAVFDADFRPREDFFEELLPYFYEYKSVGLVQSPQFFDVSQNQNWLQRGAGAVQELFYRMSQVSRQGHDSSICVGTNAIYRREALSETGGTALIHHSEDVHTGFNMRIKGWDVRYVPIILAKGLCPSDMQAFFKQQYRWCLGSMSLLTSKKFWTMKMSFIGRLSYLSGFLYYIHTGISSVVIPLIPISILLLFPEHVRLYNVIFIIPSIIYVQLVYPFWHKATYGIEAWATRSIYGWSHLIAIVDGLLKRSMSWQPTGVKLGQDPRYKIFRGLQIIFNFIPATVWVYLSADKVFIEKELSFLPLFLGGLYYYFVSAKVTFFKAEKIVNLFSAPSFFTQIRIGVVRAVPAVTFLLLLVGSLYLYQVPRITLTQKNTVKKVQSSQALFHPVVSEESLLSSQSGNITAVHNQELTTAWEYYKKHFITSEGQSIDPGREHQTTSEGQSYIMLRAALVGDREMFEKSWSWTQENLQHAKGDKLFSWLYGKEGKIDQVISTDNASDADEDIALALIIAGASWKRDDYTIEAKEIIKSLWESNVVEVKGRNYLIAGAQFKKPTGYVINPSYLSPASYRVFARIDKEHDWEKLSADSYYLLSQIAGQNDDSVGIPPNWIFLSKTGEIQNASSYAGDQSDIYGYDAFRTFFRVALDREWFGSEEAKDYLSLAAPFFETKWNEKKKFSTYTLVGEARDASPSTSMAVGPLSVFTQTDRDGVGGKVYTQLFEDKYNEEGYWGDGKQYYDQNWAWFGTALYTDSLTLPPSLQR